MDPEVGLLELPPVRLPPFGELVEAARRCAALQSVLRLAEWTGDRKVTKAGNLTLADARTANRDLGLPDHPEARAARGFPELQTCWELAVDLELLTVDAGRAELVAETTGQTDREIVELWIDLLTLTVQGLPILRGDEVTVMPLLMRLYVDAHGIRVEELAAQVLDDVAAIGADWVNVSAGQTDALTDLLVAMVRRNLDRLAAIDAVVLDGDVARLTDLGRFGLLHWFEMGGIRAPYVNDLAGASVADLLGLGLTQHSTELFDEWLAAIGSGTAIERILAHARGGTPLHRVIAFGMLDRLGPVAEQGVRACLDDRDLRPHANAWLTGHGLPAEQSTLDDLHRVFIDMVAADLDGDPRSERDSVRGIADEVEYDASALFENLWQCEHPATLEVLKALARYYPDPIAARVAQEGVMHLRSTIASPSTTYRLKVVLRGTKPPVWRRIQVPGTITLAGLHAVIQTAMGWTNSHLHEFEIAGRDYGEIDPDAPEDLLEAADFTLEKVARKGDKFDYLYDFGDGWRHQVTVEQVLPASDEPVTVQCLAGRRNCPPEDVGGTGGYEDFLEAYLDPAHEDHRRYRDWLGDGFDPDAFDRASINADLAGLLVD
ncbi:pRiA4b ORF-3-like protein [Kribbella sp. VKM Ac-2527]|uniref:PRiA4b ORF-3-like protein n=1 Tax=Kribbella caucasensis TaxID=2512215 RepID=A0A4V3C5I8_9ACTN|nr:plasmid pRiA4b ORF-3 family protein [Kribbella sp. VKM Ac-2527]TDO30008.1 pRiA4b ORF-3-like protein [Kribbella sp. VKM Ac-2527]